MNHVANYQTVGLADARAAVLRELDAVEQHAPTATPADVELLLTPLESALAAYLHEAQLRAATRNIVSEPILVALRTALSAAVDSGQPQRISAALDELREELADHARASGSA